MLTKGVAALYEKTDDNIVVQHPNFGRIDYRNLDVKTADWLVEHGFMGLKRIPPTPEGGDATPSKRLTDMAADVIPPPSGVGGQKNTDSKP
jgi:hypothetical protein